LPVPLAAEVLAARSPAAEAVGAALLRAEVAEAVEVLPAPPAVAVQYGLLEVGAAASPARPAAVARYASPEEAVERSRVGPAEAA